MSAPTKERSDARRETCDVREDGTPRMHHVAHPDTDDIALCGTRRPADRPIFYGDPSRLVDCIVCIELWQVLKKEREE